MIITKGLVSTLALALFTAALVADDPKDEAKEEVKKLQGTWQVTKHIDESGQEASADELANHTFEFKDDHVVIRHSKKDDDDPGLKYTLDPTKNPKAIDIDFGKRVPVHEGIYKLDGDELTICIVSGYRDDKPAPRPSEFKANKQNKYVVFVLKKVKQ